MSKHIIATVVKKPGHQLSVLTMSVLIIWCFVPFVVLQCINCKRQGGDGTRQLASPHEHQYYPTWNTVKHIPYINAFLELLLKEVNSHTPAKSVIENKTL